MCRRLFSRQENVGQDKRRAIEVALMVIHVVSPPLKPELHMVGINDRDHAGHLEPNTKVLVLCPQAVEEPNEMLFVGDASQWGAFVLPVGQHLYRFEVAASEKQRVAMCSFRPRVSHRKSAIRVDA